jgi:hypothetical protein
MKKFFLILAVFLISSDVSGFDLEQFQIHGFVSQGYLKSSEHDFWFTPTEDGTFQFNETGINFAGMPADNLRIGIQFLARDLGEIGNNEVNVDWAYADYQFRNWLGIRAGLLKRPYGLYSRIRDIDAARTSVFLPISHYVEVNREYYLATQGIGIYGLLPGGFSYEFQYGTIPLETDDGIVKQAEFYLGGKARAIENEYVIAAELQWETPVDGLMVAVSGFDAAGISLSMDIGEVSIDKFESYNASLNYRSGDFSFSAEYRCEPIKVILNSSLVAMDVLGEGYYAGASYRFTDWFELGAVCFAFYSDKDDRKGDFYKEKGQPGALAWRRGFSLSTRFDISDHWIFKMEGHFMNGLNGVYALKEADPSEDWFLFASKLTFTF